MLTLVATKAGSVDDHDRWVAALREINASTGATLWRLLAPPTPGRPGPGFTHILRFDATEGAARHDAMVAEARKSGQLPVSHAEIRRDHWVLHRGTPADQPITGLIAAEVLPTDPTRHQEWDRWYDEQHLPDMMASSAFVAGTRWQRADFRPGGTNDLTLYEISGISVEEAIATSAAVMPGLVAAGRKHETHAGGLTIALERVE